MTIDQTPDDGSAGRRRLIEAGVRLGPGVRAWLGADVRVGRDVTIGAGTVLAADTLTLGDGVTIGEDCDLRAGTLFLGDATEIQSSVTVLVADAFEVEGGGRIESLAQVTCRSFQADRLLYLGRETSVGYGGTTASTSHVVLGARVAIGPHSILNANQPIILGDEVGSGSHLTIWTHGFHFGHRLLDGYPATFAPVRVERNVWLAYHATVLPGVTIGAGTIVAAGSVVSRDLPAGVLAGGVPAAVKRTLAPRPPQGDEAHRRVDALLDEWVAELHWKGLPAKRALDGPIDVGDGHRVLLVTGTTGLDTVNAHADAAGGRGFHLLTVDDRPDLRPWTGRTRALFELRSGRLTGCLDDVGHDLRDFLRRNALPCGDQLPFRSLPVEGFARLAALTRKPTTTGNGR
ncbi:DapH/DapD/GlmU-related protein [Streptomyces sp. NPDC048362]|uniref:DapH/DapD/GlmU-related protein n=1 Tax=Streptomyces sp. NPDC048362 TaxID=3365539 RepID=UPI00371C2F6F